VITSFVTLLGMAPPLPLLLIGALLLDMLIKRGSAKASGTALAPLEALRKRLDRSGRGEGALRIRGTIVGVIAVVCGAGATAFLGRLLAGVPFGWLGELAALAALMGARAPLDAVRRAIVALAGGSQGVRAEPLARIALERLGNRFVDGPAAIFGWLLLLGPAGLGVATAGRLAGALAQGTPEAPFSRGLIGVHRLVMAPAAWVAALALLPANLALPRGRPVAMLVAGSGSPMGAAAGGRALAAGIGCAKGPVAPSDLQRGALLYGLGCVALVALVALVVLGQG